MFSCFVKHFETVTKSEREFVKQKKSLFEARVLKVLQSNNNIKVFTLTEL